MPLELSKSKSVAYCLDVVALAPARTDAVIPLPPVCRAVSLDMKPKTPKQVPTLYRNKAQLRAQFVAEVLRMAEEHGVAEEMACALIARRDAERYHAIKLSYGSFRNWKKALAESNGNLDGLIDGYGQGRPGVETKPAFLPFLTTVLEVYAQDSKPEVATIYNTARLMAIKKGMHPECIPTVLQVRHWLKTKVPQAGLKLKREGPEFAQNHLIDHLSRDWSAVLVGQLLIADSHTMDAPCKIWDPEKDNGVGNPKGGWKAVRPKVICWYDGRSLRFLSVRLLAGTEPNRFEIENGFMLAMRALGMRPPLDIYIDNGKDYKSMGFAEPVTFVVNGKECEHSIIKELGIRRHVSLPYRGRSKTIERAFKEFAKGFARLMPGYRGGNVVERPENAEWFYKHPEVLPTAEEYEALLITWIEEIFHKSYGKASKVTGGLTPDEMWKLYEPLRPAMSMDELRFAMLRPLSQPHCVFGGGVVKCRCEWWSEDLYPFVGRDGFRVMLKADMLSREDFGLAAFHLDGSFICWLEKKSSVPALCSTDEEYALLKEETRERNAFRPYMRKEWEEFRTEMGMASRRTINSVDPVRAWLGGMTETQTTSDSPLTFLPRAAEAAKAAESAEVKRIEVTAKPKALPVEADIQVAMKKALFGGVADKADEFTGLADAGSITPEAAPDISGAGAALESLQDALDNMEL